MLWIGATCRITNRSVVLCGMFIVQAKVNFIADGLKPDNDRLKAKAGAGIGIN